jgi:hypothetical protein
LLTGLPPLERLPPKVNPDDPIAPPFCRVVSSPSLPPHDASNSVSVVEASIPKLVVRIMFRTSQPLRWATNRLKSRRNREP